MTTVTRQVHFATKARGRKVARPARPWTLAPRPRASCQAEWPWPPL